MPSPSHLGLTFESRDHERVRFGVFGVLFSFVSAFGVAEMLKAFFMVRASLFLLLDLRAFF